jgi:hypothetical protein
MDPTQLLDPLIIAAPTVRSGSTLLQRLCCSSSNGLIFGESCANDFDHFINIFLAKKMYLEMGSNWRNAQLSAVINGDANDWIADLMPEPDRYLEMVENNFKDYFYFFKKYALEKNRPIWGMKKPGWNPYQLRNTLNFLPKAKLVYLIRDLESCVKSAKKQDMIRTPIEIEQFSREWKAAKDFAENQLNKPKMIIYYENLISNTEEELLKLEAFSGLKEIDRTIIHHKINNFKEADNPDGYDSPADLNSEELSIIEKFK